MDMQDYYWVITQDHNDDPEVDQSMVGTLGGSGRDLIAAQVSEHPEAIEFRMRDEVGKVLYHGFYVGDYRDEEAMAEPLHLFGQHNGQCAQIAYRDLMGRWEVLAWI